MKRSTGIALVSVIGIVMAGSVLAIQDPKPLAVGEVAPDFALAGATSEGVLGQPVRLRDFRDQTVVIAFFYKARTKG
jgi:hypothetical protein